jgi:hypothetical protein
MDIINQLYSVVQLKKKLNLQLQPCNMLCFYWLQYHLIILHSCSAEVLDKHLSMVQRDHEQKSQIVERRIRDDAALEEAKRKEQATKEEKLRQERARQEAEVCYAQI